MKKILLFIGIIGILTSCSTYQKQQRKFIKFASDNPLELARLCSDRFPSEPIFVKGEERVIKGETIFIKGDSIKCPDGIKVKVPDKEIQCPDFKGRVDTLKVKDEAGIFILQSSIKDLQHSIEEKNRVIKSKDDELLKLEIELKEKDKKLLLRLSIIIGLSALMLVATVLKIKKII